MCLASQKHFRCTMVGPVSSYSCFEIQSCWKKLSEFGMDPQTPGNPAATREEEEGAADRLCEVPTMILKK